MISSISLTIEERRTRFLEAVLVLVCAIAVAGAILQPKTGMLILGGCAALGLVALASDLFRGGVDGVVVCWAAAFPLSYFASFPQEHPVVTLQRVVVLLAILGLLFAKAGKRTAMAKPLRRAGIACLAFIVVAGYTLKKSPDLLGSARVLLDGFFLPVLFGWFVSTRFDIRRWLPSLHTAVCISSVICAAIAAAEIVTGQDLLPFEGSSFSYTAGIARPNGPFSTNDALALVGALSLFFLLFFRVALGPKLSGGRKLLHSIGLAGAIGMAFMPQFRSVALTLLLVLIIDIFWEKRVTSRLGRFAILLAFVGLVLIARVAAPDMFEDRSSADNVYGRVAQYEQSLVVFAEHPVLGVGFFNFNNYVAGEPRYFASYEGVASVDWPHSNLAAVLAETGTLGFVSYMMMHFLLLAAMWRLRHVSSSGRLVWKYFVYMFLTYWITGLTETSGYDGFLNLWYVFAITIFYKYVLTEAEPMRATNVRVPSRAFSAPVGTS